MSQSMSAPTLMAVSPELITAVKSYVQEYMSNCDSSHDFHHILRVVGIAHNIYHEITSDSDTPTQPPLDLPTITLCALLHDIGDHKYPQEGQNPHIQVRSLLLFAGATPELASKIQTICSAVSFTEEKKDPAKLLQVILAYPELAVVQDADRLDALGAVGAARVLTYGALKAGNDIVTNVETFEKLLYPRALLMKTAPGKRMAKERCERLMMFETWFKQENTVENVGMGALKQEEEWQQLSD